MFDRPNSGEKAVLVHITFSGDKREDELEEFQELALAAGAISIGTIKGTRQEPDPKYYVGTGKADEILREVKATQAELVLVNHSLSPAQERNLERLLQCRVLDRTGLILDIFAQRARTFEGKLQVELAQLQHMATRLVRGWTHLERQKGGIGLRGPGETQLETDRRLIRGRIKTITKRLEKVKQQRAQSRRARQRSALMTVSIVGYTNAGKSTLFNRVTAANVYVANQPFATLDPTLRRMTLPSGMSLILADTVGFVRQLPHDLVEAFHATLEETQQANLLIHVIDAHTEGRRERIEQVNAVLAEIEAQEIPQLLIYNKVDLIADEKPHIDRDQHGKPWRIWLSAITGEGIELLQQALSELLEKTMLTREVKLTPKEGKLRANLYALGAVCSESLDDEGCWHMTVRMTSADFTRLFPEEGSDSPQL
jgi:GTP-binding protein HflX